MKILLEEIIETHTEENTSIEKCFKSYDEISVDLNGFICVNEKTMHIGNDIDLFVKTGEIDLDYKRYREMDNESYKYVCKLIEKAADENKTLKIKYEKIITKSIFNEIIKVNGFVDIYL